jgi:sulfite reductase beta subunit
MISHTQGWLHCDIPGTDASGAVKALMDELYSEFVREDMPNRVHMSTSCCEINCGGQADIAIIVQHTKPPRSTTTWWPTSASARRWRAARWRRSGRRWSTASLRWKSTRRNASAAAPATPVPADADQRPGAFQAGHLGGRQELQRARQADLHEDGRERPAQQPAALARVSEIVKKILYTYKEDARSWERVSDWVERIGWPRFFEKCDLPFTKYLIDDWRGSRANLNASTHIRF